MQHVGATEKCYRTEFGKLKGKVLLLDLNVDGKNKLKLVQKK
jgi:hypothetical protein